jgi:hypothetical protein
MLEKEITGLLLEASKIESERTGFSSLSNVGHADRTIGNANLHLQPLVAEDGCQIQASAEAI